MIKKYTIDYYDQYDLISAVEKKLNKGIHTLLQRIWYEPSNGEMIIFNPKLDLKHLNLKEKNVKEIIEVLNAFKINVKIWW